MSDEGPHSEELRTTGHAWNPESGRCRVCGKSRDAAGWAENCPAVAAGRPSRDRIIVRDDPVTGDLITTVEELDALPVVSVVMGDDGKAWQKSRSGSWWTIGRYSRFPANAGGLRPATVLYRPDRPALSDAALSREQVDAAALDAARAVRGVTAHLRDADRLHVTAALHSLGIEVTP